MFLVLRVCGCILNSRHMALRRNLLFIYFATGNDPGRVLDPLWHPRGRAGRLLIAHWIASCWGYVWCIGLIGRHRTACERQSDVQEIGPDLQLFLLIWGHFYSFSAQKLMRLFSWVGCMGEPLAPAVAPTTGYPMSYKKPPCTPPGVHSGSNTSGH